MSDIDIFNDPNETPQPKDQIRIEDLAATAYDDGQRIYVEIQVTPFQERPNLILVLYDEDGNAANELNVIATMHAKMEFTMHLRDLEEPAGDYTLEAELFYDTRNPPQDKASVSVTVPDA